MRKQVAPLYVVTGAPGAGKTELLPALVARADGPVVMEMDEILENGSLLGIPIADPAAEPQWPAYDRMWDRIVGFVRRAGHPVILLGPVPSAEEVAGRWPEPVRWALLDCADEVRLERLRARDWPVAWVEEAMADAKAIRPLVPTVFRTDERTPAQLADRILAWVADQP